jgi:nucleoside-diphosphate-sugar epimerase
MILLTGGTGFLGAHILAHLLERGERIVLLARARRGVSAADRVGRLLDWLGVPAGSRGRLKVVEGSLDRPGFGLERSSEELPPEGVNEVVHCASNTSFAERRRVELEAVNLGGLERMLDLAGYTGCRRFHLVSTAYVAGLTSGHCAEELVRPSAFTNVYEETKCRAEWLAAERCSKAGIRLSIYRPSIVYGHSQTGRSLLFNALYYPVRAALYLKDLYDKDIRESGGKKAEAMGVRIEPDGWTVMPVRIRAEDEGGLNIIPVDFFVHAFAAVREDATDGGVFHIVNGRPTRIEDIIAFGQRLFHIRGFSACLAEELEGKPRNALEKVYDTYLDAYGPYIRDRRVFGTEKSGPVLKRRGIHCPELTFDIFKKCMEYGVQCGWGSHLFC